MRSESLARLRRIIEAVLVLLISIYLRDQISPAMKRLDAEVLKGVPPIAIEAMALAICFVLTILLIDWVLNLLTFKFPLLRAFIFPDASRYIGAWVDLAFCAPSGLSASGNGRAKVADIRSSALISVEIGNEGLHLSGSIFSIEFLPESANTKFSIREVGKFHGQTLNFNRHRLDYSYETSIGASAFAGYAKYNLDPQAHFRIRSHLRRLGRRLLAWLRLGTPPKEARKRFTGLFFDHNTIDDSAFQNIGVKLVPAELDLLDNPQETKRLVGRLAEKLISEQFDHAAEFCNAPA